MWLLSKTVRSRPGNASLGRPSGRKDPDPPPRKEPPSSLLVPSQQHVGLQEVEDPETARSMTVARHGRILVILAGLTLTAGILVATPLAGVAH